MSVVGDYFNGAKYTIVALPVSIFASLQVTLHLQVMHTATRLEAPHFEFPTPTVVQTSCGGQIILLPMHGATTISIAVVARAGTAHEPVGGIATITAKLLLRGTQTLTQAQLSAAFDILGASFGEITTPTSIGISATGLPEHFEQIAQLLAMCINEPGFQESEFLDVRSKALASLPLLLSDSGYRARRIFSILRFGDHPFSRCQIGTPTSLIAINVNDVHNWYENLLNKAQWQILVLGRFDIDNALSSLEQLFRTLPAGQTDSLPLPPESHNSAIGIGQGVLTEQIELRCGHAALPITSPDYPATLLIATAYAGYFLSRINTLLRETEGLTYGAYGGLTAGKHAGTFTVATSTTPQHFPRVMELLTTQWKRLASEPFDSQELHYARQHLYSSFWRSVETPESIAALVLDLTLNNLPLDYYTIMLSTIDRYTPESLMPIQNSIFDSSRLLVSAVGNLGELYHTLAMYGQPQHILLEEEQQ